MKTFVLLLVLHTAGAFDPSQYLNTCNIVYTGLYHERKVCLHETMWDGKGQDDLLAHIPSTENKKICFRLKNTTNSNFSNDVHKLINSDTADPQCSFVFGNKLYCLSIGPKGAFPGLHVVGMHPEYDAPDDIRVCFDTV